MIVMAGGGDVGEREYFVLSITHTQRHYPYIVLWGTNDAGYRGKLESAGRYTESQIKANLGYYNTGCGTVAVPCDVTESLACRVRPFDYVRQ